jgi:flagellar biosynthetic protein FliR
MILGVQQIEVFFLIFARIIGIFIQAPLINSRSIPATVKVGFAVWMTMVLWFVTPIYNIFPTSLVGFIIALVFEVAIGYTMGFICYMLFLAVQAAGEFMDTQMGLSVASTLDPIFGATISVIGRLSFYLSLVIFVTSNGHHMLFSALHQSFTYLPVGKLANFTSPALFTQLIDVFSSVWATSFKLAAPVILLIFLSDFSFGIVSRVAPQVNVFMLGFQVKPILGLMGIMLALPLIVKYINTLIALMLQQMVILSQTIK